MKTLGFLAGSLLHKKVIGSLDVRISGIAYHSDRVRPGTLFACLPGTRSHGTEYVGRAVAAGAVAVLTDGDEIYPDVTTITVPDIRLALSLVSACFYDYPSRKLFLTAVTGTNGKTTTTHLIDALLQKTGAVTGLLGTVRYRIGEQEFPVLATTPESCDLQLLLHRMASAGVTHATMEVSSHALSWGRTVGCDFNYAVLTNITEDHLDFHQTLPRYLEAKSKLFSWLGSFPYKGDRLRRAIINGDDKHYRHVLEQTPVEAVLYGLSPHCHIRASNIRVTREGVAFTLHTPEESLPFQLQLTGLFSVYNALAALSVGYLEGIPLALMQAVLAEVPGIPGRFELVNAGQNFTVIVDYAHTPDGLENVLRAVREFATARVITVFGCGGERDRTKRPQMGEVAGSYSDYCLVTNDNPRSEDPGQIVQEIIPGLLKSKDESGFEIIIEREAAIARALDLAREGDVVLIAGKGHETSQIYRNHAIPFDDRAVARELIRRRLKRDGDELYIDTGGSER
jgi:UDP-N-acetylmuramyl-tripeptide synthetase